MTSERFNNRNDAFAVLDLKAKHRFKSSSSVCSDLGSPEFGTNQFLILAAGGVGINTSSPSGTALAVAGPAQITGGLRVTGQSQPPHSMGTAPD